MDYDESDPLYEEKMLDDFFDGKIQMTPYFELEKRGCAPPFIENLPTDEDVTRELTNLIWNLEDLSIYIYDTDHLNDRDLYVKLLEFCDEPNMFFPGNKNSALNWSPDEGDEDIYLRYYADDSTRAEFKDDAGVPLPPKEKLPYPRPWIPKWLPGLAEQNRNPFPLKFHPETLFVVKDIDASVAFYKKIGAHIAVVGDGFGLVDWAGIPIHLIVEGDPVPGLHLAPPQAGNAAQWVVVPVEDCKEVYKLLCDRGVESIAAPYVPAWGTEIRCFFSDPDGHVFEISQPHYGGMGDE